PGNPLFPRLVLVALAGLLRTQMRRVHKVGAERTKASALAFKPAPWFVHQLERGGHVRSEIVAKFAQTIPPRATRLGKVIVMFGDPFERDMRRIRVVVCAGKCDEPTVNGIRQPQKELVAFPLYLNGSLYLIAWQH